MDTTAQPFGTTQGKDPGQVASEPTQPQPVVPASPVSGPVKEAEPVALPSEYIQPTEQHVEMPQEVREAGVEAVRETPDLTLHDQKAGIELAKEATPVAIEPSGMMQMPMTKEKAEETIKIHKKISDSVVWLATMVLRQLKMLPNK